MNILILDNLLTSLETETLVTAIQNWGNVSAEPVFKIKFKFGSQGRDNGHFYGPNFVDTDKHGNIYVREYSNYRIQKFGSNG